MLATEGTSVRRLRLDLDPAKEAGTVKRQASSVASSRPLPSTKSHISTTTAYPPYRNAMMDYEAISSPYELIHRCVWSLQTSAYVCRVRGRFDTLLANAFSPRRITIQDMSPKRPSAMIPSRPHL